MIEEEHTLEDINDAILYAEDKVDIQYLEVIIDALEFYKDTHYIG